MDSHTSQRGRGQNEASQQSKKEEESDRASDSPWARAAQAPPGGVAAAPGTQRGGDWLPGGLMATYK